MEAEVLLPVSRRVHVALKYIPGPYKVALWEPRAKHILSTYMEPLGSDVIAEEVFAAAVQQQHTLTHLYMPVAPASWTGPLPYLGYMGS